VHVFFFFVFSAATLHLPCFQLSYFIRTIFFFSTHFPPTYVARRYYAAIDNKGSKAIYAQFGVNGGGDDGSAPLFAQVHVRHFRGENHDIYGPGLCMNADQFFNMVTHIPNLVEVLETDMAVQVPAHIRPILTLLNGNDDTDSGGAGSATS